MADRLGSIDAPVLSAGVSTQPAHLRYPSQVEGATNVWFDVLDGCSRRPGTRLVKRLTGMTASATYRMKAIHRDATEKYLLIVGGTAGTNTVRIIHSDGTLATVNVDSDTQTYLNSGTATADDLRIVSLGDYTIIANSKVSTAVGISDNYTIADTVPDADVAFQCQPANGSYIRTLKDTVSHPAGYWFYNATNTDTTAAVYPFWVFAQVSNVNAATINSTNWLAWNAQPSGFKATLRRRTLSLTGCTYTAATRTITKTGAFTGETLGTNMAVYLSAGTGILAGWYQVASISTNSLTLTTSPGGSDNTNTALDYIGVRGDVAVDLLRNVPADIYDVAKQYTKALRDAGFTNALCNVRVGPAAGAAGNIQFYLVGGWAGTQSVWEATVAPSTGVFSRSGAGYEFNAGSSVAGSGTSDTSANASGSTAPESRWTRVAAPNQPSTKPTASTLPVKVSRTTYSAGGSTFTGALNTWINRLSGDKFTNPAPTLIAQGRKITGLAFLRNRFVMGGGEAMLLSQDGDFFNIFSDDYKTLKDSDPIDRSLGSDQVTIIDRIAPVRKTLVVFTQAGRQFEVSAGDTLTPSTAAITPTTSKAAQSTDPVNVGGRLFFAGSDGASGILYEYGYSDAEASSEAADVSAHARGYLPATIRTVVACPNQRAVFCLGSDSAIYVYRFFYSGDGGKEQSAWSKWTFDASYRVCDIAVIDNSLFLLVESQSQYVVEKIELGRSTPETGIPFIPHLDRVMTATGVHAAGTTTWTLPQSMSDTTITKAVLATGVATGSAGDTITVSCSGTTATTSGNYSGAAIVLGRPISSSIQLSRPFMKDQNGRPIFNQFATQREVVCVHANSGAYSVRTTQQGRSDRTTSFAPASGYTETLGVFRAVHSGKASEIATYIETSSATPLTIVSAQIVVDGQDREVP